MTSLPIPASWMESPPAATASGLIGPALDDSPNDSPKKRERILLQAFRSFARVAGSLEQSYGELQAEVERLRRELAEKDGDLAHSVAERRADRARLTRILEGLPCGVLVVFDNGKVWKANPEAQRLFQTGSSEALDSITALPLAFQQLLARVRDQGGEPELKLDPPSGATAWIAARHASIAENMSVFILRDVSEHKKLEETKAQRGRDQALAEMSAILAHEIRNPLGSLELFAGLLADSGLDGERRQWVEHMQAGLRTLAATVNNVLHFHSLPRAQFSSVDAGELLDWVRNFCGPLARQSGVTLSLQNYLSGVSLPGNRHRLEQVLLNLVLNSIRAAAGGGWIEVSGRLAKAGQLELAVADNGPGISPACLPKIFAPGFSTRSGSPGLGLAVCRKIVEQHGGVIWAESSPQRGTRICLTLPMTRAEEAGS